MLKVLLLFAVIAVMSMKTKTHQIFICQRFMSRMFCNPESDEDPEIVREPLNNHDLIKTYRNMNMGMDKGIEDQTKKKRGTKIPVKDDRIRVTKL